MSLSAGFAKAKKASQELTQKREENRAAGSVSYFRLESGDTKRIRFMIGPDEPYMFRQHWVPRLNTTLTCREDDSCVACGEAEAGDSGIGKSTFRAAVTMFDYSKIRRTPKGDNKYEYSDADEDAVVGKSKDGSEILYSGKRYWSISQTLMDQLLALENNMNKRCKSCGTGKIKVTEFACEKCDETIQAATGDAKIKCGSCGHVGKPVELIECSKCDEPVRASINDLDWEVTKSGSGKNTSFVFQPLDIEPMDESVLKGKDKDYLEPLKFDLIFKALSPAEMARKLGVRAEGYVEDQTEEYEEETQEEEETEEDKVASAKANSKGKLSIKGKPAQKSSIFAKGKKQSEEREARDPFGD